MNLLSSCDLLELTQQGCQALKVFVIDASTSKDTFNLCFFEQTREVTYR